MFHKAAHPEKAKDTLTAAALAVIQINMINSRALSVQDSAIISICSIHGGSSYNVIPKDVRLEGTVRSFDSNTTESIIGEIRRISESSANAYKTDYNFEYHYGYPIVVNSKRETDVVRDAATILGKPPAEIERTPIGEDFSRYLEKVPGCFFIVGIRNEEIGAVHPLHSCHFKLDEPAMKTAIEMFLAVYLTDTGQLQR